MFQHTEMTFFSLFMSLVNGTRLCQCDVQLMPNVSKQANNNFVNVLRHTNSIFIEFMPPLIAINGELDSFMPLQCLLKVRKFIVIFSPPDRLTMQK